MADPIDFDKMEKLPAGCRFFDVNDIVVFSQPLGRAPVVSATDFRQCHYRCWRW